MAVGVPGEEGYKEDRRFRARVMEAIGCRQREAEAIRRFYVKHRIMRTGVIPSVYLDPSILRKALAMATKRPRSS